MENKIETFRELLLIKLKVPSKELKQRLSNKQLKINNNPISKLEIEINFDPNEDLVDLGTFLTTLTNDTLRNLNLAKSVGIDFKDFFGEHDFENTRGDSPAYMLQFREFILLTISKNEFFVFKRNKTI